MQIKRQYFTHRPILHTQHVYPLNEHCLRTNLFLLYLWVSLVSKPLNEVSKVVLEIVSLNVELIVLSHPTLTGPTCPMRVSFYPKQPVDSHPIEHAFGFHVTPTRSREHGNRHFESEPMLGRARSMARDQVPLHGSLSLSRGGWEMLAVQFGMGNPHQQNSSESCDTSHQSCCFMASYLICGGGSGPYGPSTSSWKRILRCCRYWMRQESA